MLLQSYQYTARRVETRPTLLAPPECPVCGGDCEAHLYEIGDTGHALVQCERCGIGRVHPLPEPESLAGYYPPEYYGSNGAKFRPFLERMVRVLAWRRIRFLTRGLRPGARILDIGCGRGATLGPLADRGFDVWGVEHNAAAARGLDPRVKLRIAPDLAEAGLESDSFDQIVLWHVLEHVPNPRETLAEIHRLLKPGGRFVVAVPNFSSLQARWAGPAWFHLDLPRHLFHFPVEALRTLLDDVGFERRSEHHFSLRYNPFGWLQSALNRWFPDRQNELYVSLQNQAPGTAPSWTWGNRLAYWLGMPVGLALSLFDAFVRSGATVHIVATKPAG